MARTTANPLCIFCAVEMVLKTIFGKQVYECPKCKRLYSAKESDNA